MCKIKFFLVLLLLNNKILAGNHMLIFGAGGEPKEVFYQTYETLTTKANNLNFEKTVLYNGGNKVLDPLSKQIKTKVPKKNFNKENLEIYLQTTLEKIAKGQIKKGEQILLYLDSHGAMREENTEESHSVVDNKNEMINLDLLQDLLEEAEKNGIKIALLDFSCHSGASLELQKFNKNACIITGSSENNFAYGDFSNHFSSLLIPGKNLEEIFLIARKKSIDPGLPQINTPEGLKVREKVKELDKLFFDNENDPTDPSSRKLFDYIESIIETNDIACYTKHNFSQNLDSITKLIAHYQKINRADRVFLLNTFKKNIEEKRDIIKRLINHSVELQKFENLKAMIKANGEEIEMSYEDIAALEIDKRREELKDRIKNPETKPGVIKEYQIELDFLKETEKMKKELSKNKDFKKISEIVAKVNHDNKYFDQLTRGMPREERIYYDDLYKQEKKSTNKNPCQEFTL